MSKRTFKPEYKKLMTHVHPTQMRFGENNARHKVTYRGISERVDEVVAGMEAGQYGLVDAEKNIDITAIAGRIARDAHVPVLILSLSDKPICLDENDEDEENDDITTYMTYRIIRYLDDTDDGKARIKCSSGFNYTDNAGVMESPIMHGIRDMCVSKEGLPVIVADLRGADIVQLIDASTGISDIVHGFGLSALTLLDYKPHSGIDWMYNSVVKFDGPDIRKAYYDVNNYRVIKAFKPFRVIW